MGPQHTRAPLATRSPLKPSPPDGTGGEYVLHFDADWQNPRALTVLHYLDDGRGSTWFPLAITDDGRREEGGGCTGGWHPQTKEEAVAACEGGGGLDPASDGLRISPRTGDAIAFYNVGDDGGMEMRSIHAGLPAPATKRIASQFVRIPWIPMEPTNSPDPAREVFW